MTEPSAAFHDLPGHLFPFTIQLLDASTREVRWEQVIEGPAVLRVPSRGEINDGLPLAARIVYADGSTEEVEPDG